MQRDSGVTDGELVRRSRRRERFAENAIYRRYAPYLFGVATRLTGRSLDADDIVQETFVTAFRKLDMLNDPDALKGWLICILASQVKRTFRLRRLKSFFGLDTGEDDALLHTLVARDAGPEIRLELRRIDETLKSVRPIHRAAWMLRRVEGMSIRETAEAVDRSMATVKRHIAAVDALLGGGL